MEYVFIVIFVIIILIFIIKIIDPKIKKKKLKENLTDFLNKENLKFKNNSKSDLYDIQVSKENQDIYIKLVIVPSYSEIQINNKSTWEVKYGAGNTVGKVQPHRRYLTEIVSFMNKDFGENAKKLIIFSPTPKKIVKYLNENEIDFVKSTTDVYGANVTSIGKYEILKNKL